MKPSPLLIAIFIATFSLGASNIATASSGSNDPNNPQDKLEALEAHYANKLAFPVLPDFNHLLNYADNTSTSTTPATVSVNEIKVRPDDKNFHVCTYAELPRYI